VLKISSRRIQGDDPELASSLRIEERELQAGAYLWRSLGTRIP
jgi:hypothetical protein